MNRVLKYIAVSWLLASCLIAVLIVLFASFHQSKIAEFYKQAGKNYELAGSQMSGIEFSDPFTNFYHKLFSPKGPSINYTVFSRNMLKAGGMSGKCGRDLTYEAKFREDIDERVYANSELCCMTPLVTDFLPILYNEESKTVQVMCGFSNDAHIVSMKEELFNRYMSSFMDDNSFDGSEELK